MTSPNPLSNPFSRDGLSSSSQRGSSGSAQGGQDERQRIGGESINSTGAEIEGNIGEILPNKLWTTQKQHNSPYKPTNGTSRRNPFNDSVNMISNGGVGHSQTAPSWSPISSTPTNSEIVQAIEIVEGTLYPNNTRSLSGIALRSFLLGGALFFSATVTLFLVTSRNTPLWRLPFFLSSLSLFHFLEFFTTALANPTNAEVSSFLLSSNGWAYNVAHFAAFIECGVSHTLYPSAKFPAAIHYSLLLVGLAFVLVGQALRATAIIQAGPSFSHIVAQRKKESHVLITHGVYHYLRHPSYFGFFWWGIGTQLVLGNVICLLAYAAVLWKFFSARIQGEEIFLVRWFKDDYTVYRQQTPVGIPYIK